MIKNQVNIVQEIIDRNNIVPKYFISINFNKQNSFTLSKHNDSLKYVKETVDLDRAESNLNLFINIFYQKIYNRSKISRIKEDKFKILCFLEQGTAKRDYHAHLITEDIANKSIDEIKSVLHTVKYKHKGTDKAESGIDIIPYDKRHNHYVMKTYSDLYNPFCIKCTRI